MSVMFDLEIVIEFLFIAVMFVDLKVRWLLLGREDVDLDEELVLWEERDLLLVWLLECKIFKDVVVVFVVFVEGVVCLFFCMVGIDLVFVELVFDFFEGLNLVCLRAAFEWVMMFCVVFRVMLDYVVFICFMVVDVVVELVDELFWVGCISF